ncbi:MAG: hypothetical protein HY077_05935 [Elusimicrobia bacterium]|nr:hypothetical protein [Elusimicrobiota bacterium]
MDHPRKGPDGRPIQDKPWQDKNGRTIPPTKDHQGDMHRRDRDARDIDKRWDRNDHRYHWHDWDGHRVCHHYDQWGYHWYGWYYGSYYFWMRYYYDYWWWYDPYWHRWCYQRDGSFWWVDPATGDLYIVIDGRFYKYRDGSGGVIVVPDPTPPVEVPPGPADPAPNPGSNSFYSADGTRLVQIDGDAKNAFLHDTADPPAFEPVFLAAGVTEVRFQNDADGKLQRILCLTEDGSFKVFDPNGASLEPSQADERAALTQSQLEQLAAPKVKAKSVESSPAFKLLQLVPRWD